jgi:triosephosphate isomerase
VSCVGELLAGREAGKTIEVVGRQTDANLNAVSADEAKEERC